MVLSQLQLAITYIISSFLLQSYKLQNYSFCEYLINSYELLLLTYQNVEKQQQQNRLINH